MAEPLSTWRDVIDAYRKFEESDFDDISTIAQKKLFEIEQLSFKPEDLDHEVEAELVPFYREEITNLMLMETERVSS